MNEEGFRFGDLVAMAKRRGKVVGVVAGAILLASVFIAAILPNGYESYTTLLVEPQAISKRLVEAGLEGSDITSRLHLMTMQILSRPRLSRVIDDLGIYKEESQRMTREEVIDLMRSDIRVEPILPELERGLFRRYQGEINTFRLYYRHSSPTVAAQVANRLANDFIDEHIRERVQMSSDTAEFIESELGQLTGRTQEVEARIAQIKAENAGSLPEDLMSNQRLLEGAMMNIRLAQRELADAKGEEAFYRQQTMEAGAVADGGADAATPERRLRVLELELAQLRGRGLTEKHPDIVYTRAEIEELKKRIAEGTESGGSLPLTFAQQTAISGMQRASQRLASANEEIGRLETMVAEVEARIAKTPRIAEQLAALEREYVSLRDSVQAYSAKRLEAVVASNMERRQKGEQFRVLESAFPAPIPISPNRRLIVVMGLLFGLAAGAMVGLALEMGDRSFHAARQLQQALRAPVLASIPAIQLSADRLARRRRMLREAVAAAAVAGVVLVSSVAGYVWVNRPDLIPGRGEAAAGAAPTPTPAAPRAPSAESGTPSAGARASAPSGS